MPMTDAPTSFAVTDNPEAGRFEVSLGAETAFAEYRLEEGAIAFPHTVVPDTFAGQGVGGALVRHGLAYATERGLKVRPICSFFADFINKHPEFHDLVHPDFQSRPGIDA